MSKIREYLVDPQGKTFLMEVLAELNTMKVSDACDILWMTELEFGATESEDERLHEIIRAYVETAPSERLVPICCYLNVETLGKCGLLDADSFKKDLRKKNTFLRYRQTKFNLVREESEGYAKLVTELLSDNPHDAITCNCLAYIGYFRLDPNRVLDIVMNVVESSPVQLCNVCRVLFVDPSSSVARLDDLVGFQWSRLDKISDSKARAATMRSLATLLCNKLCSFDQLSRRFDYEGIIQSCREVDNQLLAVKYANDEMYKSLKDIKAYVYVTELVAAAIDVPKGWSLVLQVLDAFKGIERHIFRDKSVIQALQAFLLRETDLIYIAEYLKASKQRSETAQDLYHLGITESEHIFSILLPLLIRLGPECLSAFVSRDVSLLHRVIRLLGTLKISTEDNLPVVHNVLAKCVLPAISMSPFPIPVVIQELWISVVKKLPPTERYVMYQVWRESIEKSPVRPEIALCNKMVTEHVNFAFKRFCSDEEMNLIPCRKLSMAAHMNPFSAFNQALRVSDNLIPFMVRTLDLCSGMVVDVLCYMICDYLVSNKADKMKGDLTNDALWYSTVCQLVGEAFRRCPDMDLAPLVELVFEKAFVQSDWMYLRLLEVLVKETSLIDIVVDYSRALLESAGGGDTLRFLALNSFSIADQRRARFEFLADGARDNAVNRLKTLLGSHGTDCSPFYVRFLLGIAVARKRLPMDTKIAFPDAPEKSLGFVNLLFDQLTAIYLQLTSFITSEIGADKLALSMPSTNDLRKRFKLDPADYFHLIRLTLGARDTDTLRPLSRESVQEVFPHLQSQVEEATDIFTRFWELSLFDVYLPSTQYDAERARMEAIKKDLEREQQSPSVRAMHNKSVELIIKLKREASTQTSRVEKTKLAMESKRPKWVELLSKGEILPSFIQDCIIPRVLHSPEDAFYSAHFIIAFLFDSPIKRGSSELTLTERLILSSIFPSFLRIVLTCSPKETENLGDFLCEILLWTQVFEISSSDVKEKSEALVTDLELIQRWKSLAAGGVLRWLKLPSSAGDVFMCIQALTLLSAMKDAFPDTDVVANHLLAALDVLGSIEDGTDDLQEDQDEFALAQKAVVKGKAKSLSGAIKQKKKSGRYRDAAQKVRAASLPKPIPLEPLKPVFKSTMTTGRASGTPIAPLLGSNSASSTSQLQTGLVGKTSSSSTSAMTSQPSTGVVKSTLNVQPLKILAPTSLVQVGRVPTQSVSKNLDSIPPAISTASTKSTEAAQPNLSSRGTAPQVAKVKQDAGFVTSADAPKKDSLQIQPLVTSKPQQTGSVEPNVVAVSKAQQSHSNGSRSTQAADPSLPSRRQNPSDEATGATSRTSENIRATAIGTNLQQISSSVSNAEKDSKGSQKRRLRSRDRSARRKDIIEGRQPQQQQRDRGEGMKRTQSTASEKNQGRSKQNLELDSKKSLEPLISSQQTSSKPPLTTSLSRKNSSSQQAQVSSSSQPASGRAVQAHADATTEASLKRKRSEEVASGRINDKKQPQKMLSRDSGVTEESARITEPNNSISQDTQKERSLRQEAPARGRSREPQSGLGRALRGSNKRKDEHEPQDDTGGQQEDRDRRGYQGRWDDDDRRREQSRGRAHSDRVPSQQDSQRRVEGRSRSLDRRPQDLRQNERRSHDQNRAKTDASDEGVRRGNYVSAGKGGRQGLPPVHEANRVDQSQRTGTRSDSRGNGRATPLISDSDAGHRKRARSTARSDEGNVGQGTGAHRGRSQKRPRVDTNDAASRPKRRGGRRN